MFIWDNYNNYSGNNGPVYCLKNHQHPEKKKHKKNIKIKQKQKKCGLWTLELAIFDMKFGFYVKFPPYNRLERSRSRRPGQNMRKFIFLYEFFLIRALGYLQFSIVLIFGPRFQNWDLRTRPQGGNFT